MIVVWIIKRNYIPSDSYQPDNIQTHWKWMDKLEQNCYFPFQFLSNLKNIFFCYLSKVFHDTWCNSSLKVQFSMHRIYFFLYKNEELNNIFLLTIRKAKALAIKRLILNSAVLGAQSRWNTLGLWGKKLVKAKSLNQEDVRRQCRVAGKRSGLRQGGEGCSSFISGLTWIIFMFHTIFPF